MVKILIVEDELIIAEDLCNMLDNLGYKVEGIAMDADETIEMLRDTKPDLLLLDINLKGSRDGITLAAEINESFGVPFIFITSYATGDVIERAKSVKPLNFLVKPFTKEQLFSALEIAIYNLAAIQESASNKQQEQAQPLFIKDSIFIRDKFSYTKLPIEEIRWVKAEGNYIELYHDEKKVLVRLGLQSFLDRINTSDFFRTHKSYAVNLRYLSKVNPTNVLVGKIEVPLSKGYSEGLVKLLNII